MITIETLCVRFRGLRPDDLERWIALEWVHADGAPGHYLFEEIDAARVGLIIELRGELQLGDEALPVVLSLLDQLYDARRRMRRVREAIDQVATADLRERMLRHLGGDAS